MDWLWNSPFYSHYAYFLLNSNYNNTGETPLQIGSHLSQFGIPGTNFKYQPSHINPDNNVGGNNLQIPTQSFVKQEPQACLENLRDIQMCKGGDIHMTNDKLYKEVTRNNIYNCNVKLEKLEEESMVKEEPKIETKDDMHVVKDQLSFKKKINNIYNYKIKSEVDAEVTQIKEDKESETHAHENVYDMHIVKDQINVQKIVTNIQKHKVKLEEFETEELVVNENDSNTNQNPFDCIEKNCGKNECNQMLCKKEYSMSEVKQNLNNNYLIHDKTKLKLDKSESFHSQESNYDQTEPKNLNHISIDRPYNKPMTYLMTDAISSLVNTDTIIKEVKSEEPKVTQTLLSREGTITDKCQNKEDTVIKYKNDQANQIQNNIFQNVDKTTDAGSNNIDITNRENNTEQAVINNKPVIGDNTNNHTDAKIETIFIVNANNHNWDCTLCDEKFSKKRDLKQHMLVHAESDVFTCSVCHYKTLRRNRLKVHMRMHTGERPFKCAECDFASTQHGNLKHHILRYHTKELKCSDCKMLFKGKINLTRHKKTAHLTKKRYACNICDYRTNDSSALKCHAVTHSGIKNFICSDCNQGFRDKHGLKVHMLVHSGGKLLNCTECKYLTLEQRNLDRHMNMVHSTQNPAISIPVEEKKVCGDCGYACKSKFLFDKHKQVHALHGKLLNCPNCAYKCKKYSTLREHSLMHKEKVLRCKTCNYRFVNKECYEAHMITHNEK